jgi:hypothetical protein
MEEIHSPLYNKRVAGIEFILNQVQVAGDTRYYAYKAIKPHEFLRKDGYARPTCGAVSNLSSLYNPDTSGWFDDMDSMEAAFTLFETNHDEQESAVAKYPELTSVFNLLDQYHLSGTLLKTLDNITKDCEEVISPTDPDETEEEPETQLEPMELYLDNDLLITAYSIGYLTAYVNDLNNTSGGDLWVKFRDEFYPYSDFVIEYEEIVNG